MKQHITPKELSRAVGVSESSLKRWADEGMLHAVRTCGGHRRIALDEAVRFIRATGLSIVVPEALGMPELRAAACASKGRLREPAPGESLRDALLAGHAVSARGVMLGAYLAGHSIATIADHMIAPAMHQIGELWTHDACGIYVEHRALGICHEAVSQLRAMLPPPPADAPVAVGGAMAGDTYTLPSLLCATTLASEGWRDMNLGAQTPVDSLLLAARQNKARLVWVSVSADLPQDDVARELETLAQQLVAGDTRLVLGGRALPGLRVPRRANVFAAASMAELAAIAHGAKPADAAPAPVDAAAP